MKRRDRGSSLIEVVIAVALMGIVVSGVLAAMWSAIRLSRFSDDQAKVEASGTWITTNGLSGAECNETASLTTARTLQRITFMVTSPSGYSKSLEVVKSNVFPRSIS